MQHEIFIHRVVDLALARLEPKLRTCAAAKIVYGMGAGTGARGVCYYGTWRNGLPKPIPIVEICASGEESPVQVAGTTLHELGHVLAGPAHGHDAEWAGACATLGLRLAKAAGMVYTLAAFAPSIREYVASVLLSDGAPVAAGTAFLGIPKVRGARPCGLGIGTKGGKSRGAGSGSRLRRWVCTCTPPVIVRVASDSFAAHCDHCNQPFTHEEPNGQ